MEHFPNLYERIFTMYTLNENYKTKIAEDLTKLAIEHHLIRELSNEEETAISVCKFFQTIAENLDADLNK